MRIRRADQRADFLREPAGVGVEKRRAETIQDQPGLGHGARVRRLQSPVQRRCRPPALRCADDTCASRCAAATAPSPGRFPAPPRPARRRPRRMTASRNSPGLSRRMLASPRRSISLTAITKTMEPSTQRGKNCSGFVRNSSTRATTTAVEICATGCVRRSFRPSRFAWDCR